MTKKVNGTKLNGHAALQAQAKPAKSKAALKQQRYRERRDRLAPYPNSLRRKRERLARLRNSPEYIAALRERRNQKRRRNTALKNEIALSLPPVATNGSSSLSAQVTASPRPSNVLQAIRPIEAMCMLGLTEQEIAGVLGISTKRYRLWLQRSPKLQEAVKRGKSIADSKVAASMFHQATGYTVDESVTQYDTKRGEWVSITRPKYYAPNAVAGIFWLKNRQPEHWRDKREVEQSGPGAGGMLAKDVKFVIVQQTRESEKVIDADYKVLEAPEKSDDRSKQ